MAELRQLAAFLFAAALVLFFMTAPSAALWIATYAVLEDTSVLWIAGALMIVWIALVGGAIWFSRATLERDLRS